MGAHHTCCIVPPYLLRALAESDAADTSSRQAAVRTLDHSHGLTAFRQSPVAATGGGATGGQAPQNSVIPDYMLESLAEAEDADPQLRENVQQTLVQSHQVRAGRADQQDATARTKRPISRAIHDIEHKEDFALLPGKLVLAEGKLSSYAGNDPVIAECYNNVGHTFDLFKKVFGRNSIDGKALPLISTVHFGKNFMNAFWTGQQMVFGDGNDFLCNFTKSLDVICHELTHGVTQYTAGFDYENQSGALNESVSDCFGSMAKQYVAGETADVADWLIGEDCIYPGVKGVALRSMKAPGTAYDDPKFGKDPQPATMKDFVHLPNTERGDYGGVHINSGIPNHAFYLAATRLGGHSWERAGQIWYKTLVGRKVRKDCTFEEFADVTVTVAKSLYPTTTTTTTTADDAEGDVDVAKVVRQAWVDVGVLGDPEQS